MRRCMLACAAALSPAVAVLAQDGSSAGVVRISDRSVQSAGHKSSTMAPMMSGDMMGDCPECYGDAKCKKCKLGCCNEHYCKHSPDYGFSVPGKYPIHRRGVQYQHYFPNQWLGAGNGQVGGGMAYPMAYMPTDTSQLGFYYQHVPFWTPQPNPLPARPVPAQWHIVAPPYTPWARGNWGNGGWGDANCPIDQANMPIQEMPGQPMNMAPGQPMNMAPVQPINPAPAAPAMRPIPMDAPRPLPDAVPPRPGI